MARNIPHLSRVPVMAFAIICSLIILGLDARQAHVLRNHTTTFTAFKGKFNSSSMVPSYAKLGLATSVLALVSLIPMLFMDRIRAGRQTSWIAAELAWVFLLWLLFLATAALHAHYGASCNRAALNSFCSQLKAAEAFAWIAFIILLLYWLTLLAFALNSHRRGNRGIWKTTVRDSALAAGTDAPIKDKHARHANNNTINTTPVTNIAGSNHNNARDSYPTTIGTAHGDAQPYGAHNQAHGVTHPTGTHTTASGPGTVGTGQHMPMSDRGGVNHPTGSTIV